MPGSRGGGPSQSKVYAVATTASTAETLETPRVLHQLPKEEFYDILNGQPKKAIENLVEAKVSAVATTASTAETLETLRVLQQLPKEVFYDILNRLPKKAIENLVEAIESRPKKLFKPILNAISAHAPYHPENYTELSMPSSNDKRHVYFLPNNDQKIILQTKELGAFIYHGKEWRIEPYFIRNSQPLKSDEKMVFSSDGKLMAIPTIGFRNADDTRHEKTIRVYNTETGEAYPFLLEGPTSYIFNCVFHPHRPELVAITYNALYIWNLSDLSTAPTPTIIPHSSEYGTTIFIPESMCYTSDGSKFMYPICNYNTRILTVLIWDTHQPNHWNFYKPILTPISIANSYDIDAIKIAIHPNNKQIVISMVNILQLWDISDLTPANFNKPISPDAKHIQTIELRKERASNQYVKAITFSPDGSLLACSTSHRDLHIWKINTQAKSPATEYHYISKKHIDQHPVFSKLYFSSDNERLLGWDTHDRHTVVVFYVGQGVAVNVIKDNIRAAAIHPSGRVAMVSRENEEDGIGIKSESLRVYDNLMKRQVRSPTVRRSAGGSKKNKK